MNLREARDRLGLSREELSALTGVSVRTIYDVEHGLVVPRRSTRNLLALAVRPHKVEWPAAGVAEAA